MNATIKYLARGARGICQAQAPHALGGIDDGGSETCRETILGKHSIERHRFRQAQRAVL